MAPKKNNFKAKWLAAQGVINSPVDQSDANEQSLNTINYLQQNQAAELRRLQNIVTEVANAASHLREIVDENPKIGMLEFSETLHSIDKNMYRLDVVTTLRRVRDIIFVAEERIGYMSAALDEYQIAASRTNDALKHTVNSVEASQRQLVDVLLIGSNATRDELDDYRSSATGIYDRFGDNYYPLDRDTMNNFVPLTATRSRRTSITSAKSGKTNANEASASGRGNRDSAIELTHATRSRGASTASIESSKTDASAKTDTSEKSDASNESVGRGENRDSAIILANRARPRTTAPSSRPGDLDLS